LTVLLAVLLLVAPEASAKPSPAARRVAVYIEGPQAAGIRDAAVGLLPLSVEVVDPGEFQAALSAAGLTGGQLGAPFLAPGQRPAVLWKVQRAVRDGELNGAVVGRTRAGARGLELLFVYLEADGEPLIDTTVPQRGKDEERLAALESVMQVVSDSLPPPPPDPKEEPATPPPAKKAAPSEEDEEAPSDFVPNRQGAGLLSVGVGLSVGGRFFAFSDEEPRAGNLRDYDVFGVPVLRLSAEIYPGATTAIPGLRDLGLTLEYAHALGLESKTSDETYRFSSTWHRFMAALRYRFLFGDDALPFVLGASLGAGFHRFTFTPEDAAAEQIAGEVAEVEYVPLRLGVDARLPVVEMFAVLASLGYVHSFDGGATYDRFSDSSLDGMEAAFALALWLGEGFDVRAGVQWSGVFASLEADPAGAFVAQGATDHAVTLDLGLSYTY
jgi:hypothetical protein